MNCRATELTDKEAICIKDGTRLGRVSDIELNSEDGSLISMIIYGKPRLFGLLGRDEDFVIPWSEVEIIGVDTILVRSEPRAGARRKSSKLFISPIKKNGV